MGSRRTTNVLLAIIAATLLFGSALVKDLLFWVAIIAAVVLLLCVILFVVARFLRFVDEFQIRAEQRGRENFVVRVCGLIFFASFPLMFGYAFLLWRSGDLFAIETAGHSLVATVPFAFLCFGCAFFLLTKIAAYRLYLVPFAIHISSLLVRSPLAPILLPLHGWRSARTAGDGMVLSTASALIGLMQGLLVWIILAACVLIFFGK